MSKARFVKIGQMAQKLKSGDLTSKAKQANKSSHTKRGCPSTRRQTSTENQLTVSFQGSTVPSGPGPPHCRGFPITHRHTTVGRAPLDEWSAWRRDLYLTAHNTDKRQTSITPVGIEPTIPATERPQTHASDRAHWDPHFIALERRNSNQVQLLNKMNRLYLYKKLQ